MLLEPSVVIPASVMPDIDKKTIVEFGIPGEVLMENAGRTASRILCDNTDIEKSIVAVLCGPGNNGGDGFVMARYLFSRAENLFVIIIGDPVKIKGDALINFERIKKLNIPFFIFSDEAKDTLKEKIKSSDIIIDAVFGTGLKSAPKGDFAEIIDFSEKQNKFVMAVDIPSGIDGDTGTAFTPSFSANICVTFGFPKPAHFLNPGKQKTGKLFICDIGIPKTISDMFDQNIHALSKNYIKSLFIKRDSFSHKGSFGHLCIIGGSANKTGAPVMAAKAAHRSGAGLVTLSMPDAAKDFFMFDETMKHPLESQDGQFASQALKNIPMLLENKSAVVIGPGTGTAKGAQKILEFILENIFVPVVLDADALNILSENTNLLKKLAPNFILTPHPKEMSRLIKKPVKDIVANPIKYTCEFAKRYNCNIILKTSTAVIADNTGNIKINTTGNSGMAAGGSGDILSGITGAFLCQGFSCFDAVCAGAFIHGYAADKLKEEKGPFGYLPTEVIDIFPDIFKEFGL